ncbi:MAG: DUF4892 domain-containing protein [Gammaproteobacteria bacterium]|nr:DUF4892 domain-containing protein [Gammaproteobacteria bacterium]
MKRLFFCAIALGSGATFADIPSASDSDLLSRYTASTIINFELIEGAYDFVYAPVDKIKRDISFESAVRFTGAGQKITYEMPRGVSRDDAFNWYVRQLDSLGATMLFTCQGPDCGRATVWATQVFRVRALSAPDRQQSYAAYVLGDDTEQTLVALYVVERGNKRVNAHIEEVTPSEVVTFDENQGFADQLNASGVAVIQNVTPARDGSIDASAKSVISAIGQQMVNLPSRDIYVVCHIHASGTADPLIEASERCANVITEQLAEETTLMPKAVGVGPLLPVEGRKHSRVEVVVPSLMRQVSRQ